jgi:hypothetical protein
VVTKKIGLLFVHGIGEQKRFEHLTNSVRELAELYRLADQRVAVSVVDRTADWKVPPGSPDLTGPAPMTLSLVPQKGSDMAGPVDFECHEVWWADLGTRSGLGDTIGFWLWGLGQWSAIIYRLLDFSRMKVPDKDRPDDRPMVALPRSVSGHFWEEVSTRGRLAAAALAAVFTLVTLSLVKFLASKVSGLEVSPTLLVQYIGDVRQYEQRARPGDSPTSDPGHPHRVAIRRRMITETVAMAARGHDGWFIVAHSLGTVLAYNGITEIGHALPNYLPESLWRALPDALKQDDGCRRRPAVEAMMPSRPPWLDHDDVINRPALFARLDGVLTYGSPLDKFAAIWPRIVATATDRADPEQPVFREDCVWLNLAAQSDPVAGALNRYGAPTLRRHIARPKLINRTTPFGLRFLISHLDYLRSGERNQRGPALLQRLAVARWLAGGVKAESIPGRASGSAGTWLIAAIVYLAILGLAWAAAAVTLTVFGGGWDWLGGGKPVPFANFSEFSEPLGQNLGVALGIAFAALLVAGLWRWLQEAVLNADLARFDGKDPLLRRILGAMALWAGFLAAVSLAGLAILLPYDLHIVNDLPFVARPDPPNLVAARGWLTAGFAGAMLGLAILIHSLVSWTGPAFFKDTFNPKGT